MKPEGTPVASIILAEVNLEPSTDPKDPHPIIRGRGILAPGVVIPNEWWDREWLAEGVEVERPQQTAQGVLAVNFRGICRLHRAKALHDLIDAGARELVEREVVPPLLIALGLAKWLRPKHLATPLPQVLAPFATPVDWPPPPQGRPPAAVIHDLVRLSVGQAADVDRDLVLQEAVDHGMLAADALAALVAKVMARPSAPPPAPRPPRRRVRVIDV